MKQRKTRTITISIPGEYYDKLEDMAKKDDRSKSYLIRRAIDDYLECIQSLERNKKIWNEIWKKGTPNSWEELEERYLEVMQLYID